MDSGWTTQAIATFAAAVVGALVAGASIVATVVGAQRSLRQAARERGRDRWWEQWSWIAERAFSEHPAEEQAAVVMLETLSDMELSGPDDRRIALAIQVARFRNRGRDSDTGRGAQGEV